MDFTANTLFWGLIGGILPALLWLWFWLREDVHPEPKRMIIIAFIGGMIAVPLVVPFQALTQHYFSSFAVIIIIWAAVEELFKYIAAYVTSLSKKEDDEPIDPAIYMLTTALGFAAFENVLYILKPLDDGRIFFSILSGNARFVGASLLHVVTSTSIGIAMGLAFYKSKASKFLHWITGMIIAIALHSVFNLFIMKNDVTKTLITFFLVWISIIVITLFFEKIKAITKQNN